MPGEFEEFGGRHVPEALEEPLAQLADAFESVVPTEEFQDEFHYYLKHYGGRPTPVFYAETLSEMYGAEIYFKHEDLLHGGAHKLNNALGQACWPNTPAKPDSLPRRARANTVRRPRWSARCSTCP